MLYFDLSDMVHLLNRLPPGIRFIDFTKTGDPGIRDIQIDDLNRLLSRLECFAVELQLPACRQRCEALRRKTSQCRRPPAKLPAPQTMASDILLSELVGIKQAFADELGLKAFFYIPKEKVVTCEREDLFGKAVNRTFPEAKIDIKAAGNCLALDLNTAAVFHLMRVVEFGLRALAEKLRVKIPKQELTYVAWEQIISRTENKVKELRNMPGRRKKKMDELEFFQGILMECSAFKDVFRNQVMHTRAFYDEYQAKSVLNHVREFMQRLASKIS